MNTLKRIGISSVFLIIGFFSTFDVSAQIIDENEVAPVVMDLFNRKFRKATDPVWQMKDDDLAVNFVYKTKNTYAVFTREGKLIMQRTEMEYDLLKPNIQKYMKKKHRSLTMTKAEYVQEEPRKKYYYIEMIPKRMKDDPEAPVTKLYFKTTGQFESVSDGSVNNEEEEEKIEIPEPVLKEFSKRVRRANDVEWSDVDTAYRADFTSGVNTGYAILDPEGVLLLTSVRMKAKFKNLHPGIQKYIEENIDSYTFEYAEDVVKGREKYYNVAIQDKDDRPAEGEEIRTTYIQFSKSGKHIATFFPDYSVDPIEIEKDKKWAKKANETQLTQIGENFGEKDVERKDLPTNAQTFLNEHYDHEWRTMECKAMEDEEYGILYYVLMKKQGQNIQQDHYFDLHGNHIEEFD